MASRSVTLILDGRPTIEGYSSALGGFRDLLVMLTRQVAPDAEIRWELETLDATSAVTTVRGETPDPSAVERVAVEYLRVARQLRDGSGLSPSLHSPTKRILGVLDSRVPVIKFETADDDVAIFSSDVPSAIVAPPAIVSYGAVEGRVQTVSNRGGLRFTLYDLLYDKAVSCYLAEGSEHIMRDVWGRLALVEGLVKRDPITGRPTVVRQVSRVEVRDEGRTGGWRDAQGALSGLTDEPAELSIRRLRDAQ